MNYMNYIPHGEKGSINDLAKRVVTDSDLYGLLIEIHDRPTVCLNVISTLQQYCGSDIALSFAKKIIELNQ